MQLFDAIGHFFGRVEVVLAGADDELRAGEDALAHGEPMRARTLARHVLAKLPGSPLGLALLADACEAGGLDAELTLTLEDLAERVPSRGEVWVRLAFARKRTAASPDDVRDAFLRALSVAEPGSEARREALVALADLDLAQGDGARAELWLERVADRRSRTVAVRLAEARLARGDSTGARKALEGIEDDPTDARAALVRGRALAIDSDPAAFAPLLRAYVLEAPGASELLSSTLAWVRSDEATRARIKLVADERNEGGLARWRAAFARAEGKTDEARSALRSALVSGDVTAARPLLDAALEDCDAEGVTAALLALDGDGLTTATPPRDAILAEARKLPTLEAARDIERAGPALDALRDLREARVLSFASRLRDEAIRTFVPTSGKPAAWNVLLPRMDLLARAAHDLDAMGRIAELVTERARPVRLAIVGEFNAGKSTFINALIGQDIAPTGVLPTTATLHHLRYAPDPIGRVVLAKSEDGTPAAPPAGPLERIVPLGELRATLKNLGEDAVQRVEILLPLTSLTRVEILDTPGFNAPNARHTEAARAAFDEADAVIWLLDAAQPLKQSEREILEEAKREHIPVQVLVNKVDRLGDADLVTVMHAVDQALHEIGLVSWAPPLPLSARLALKGKLGDAQALDLSRWSAVQALLDEQIVARSDELKERALRRRTARVVDGLRASFARLGKLERDERDVAIERARRIAHTAASIDRDGENITRKLALSIEPSTTAWRRDLALVVTGRDKEFAATDPALARYAAERALARLAPPLADALAAIADAAGLTPAELVPLARALVRQLAFASGPTAFARRATTDMTSAGPLTARPRTSNSSSAPTEASTTSEALARAAVASLVEYLGTLATPSLPRATSSGVEAELAAFAEALA